MVLCAGVGPGEQQQLMMGQMSQMQQRSHQASALTNRLCKSVTTTRRARMFFSVSWIRKDFFRDQIRLWILFRIPHEYGKLALYS
jgi:hypothetical protein